MTRFTNGKKTVEITMQKFDGTNLTEDMSAEMLDVLILKSEEVYIEGIGEAYKITEIDYLIEYAEEWEQYKEECDDQEALEEERENDARNGLERVIDIQIIDRAVELKSIN